MRATVEGARRAKRAPQSEPVALVDMDGTIADYERAMLAALEDVLRDHDNTHHPLSDRTYDKIKLLIKQQPGFWLNLEPIRFGLKIAVELEKLGFKLMVLTKGPVRSTNAWTEKVEWCAKWLPTADVTITHDKGLVYGKVLVDDYPEYILRWLEWRPRGIVLMPRRAWNAGFRHPNVHSVSTDEDLQRVLPLLKRRLGK